MSDTIRDDTARPFAEQFPLHVTYDVRPAREPSVLEIRLERALLAARRGDTTTLTTELDAAHRLFFGPSMRETDQSTSGPAAPIQGQG